MFEPATDVGEEHVALARRADLIVVAPATATTLARLAYGLADDMLSLTVLATQAPILVAPAMDSQMWQAAATQANVSTLRERGFVFVGPESGRLASGHMGAGRMSEPEKILGAAKYELGKQGDLAGRHLVISAGGTREPIDPVRVITNRSSGKMGYALAEAARDRGARVTLVSTEPSLPLPFGVELAAVESLAEMREAVLAACASGRRGDHGGGGFRLPPGRSGRPEAQEGRRRHDAAIGEERSFLPEVPAFVVKVAFAAETENLLENAMRKPQSHGPLDLIVANDVSATDAGFGVDTNRVVILDPAGGKQELPLLTKYEVAEHILDRLGAILVQRG